MDMFCPKCGAEGCKLVHGLCESCFWEERLEGFLKEFEAPICSSCFSHLHGKRWARKMEGMPDEKVIEGVKDEFMRLVDLPGGIEIGEIKGEVVERTKSGLPSMILLMTSLIERDSGISTKVKSCGRVDYRQCQNCYHVASGKYEAMVQVRAEGRGFDDKDRQAVERVFENFYRRTEERGKMEVSEVKEYEVGIDIKFITLNAARMFVRQLTEITGASVIESAKIMGIDRRTGGSHYRTTIATKMPSLRIGDLIELAGKVFYITGYHRGRLVVKGLSDGGVNRSLSHNQLQMARKIKLEEYRRVRLESKTIRFGTFLDLEDKKFFDLPIDFVPTDMIEGDLGVLICINGNEVVYKLGGGPVGI